MRRLVEMLGTQKTIVTASCLAATLLACAPTTPVEPVQVIRYPNRLQPRLERCTSGTVPVLGPLDTIDEGRCFQYGDIYVSRTDSGLPCSLEELEVALAEAACREDATFVRILHTQTSMTSGTDCHTIRAAFFECIEMPSEQVMTAPDD
jgi:hypothetical protein